MKRRELFRGVMLGGAALMAASHVGARTLGELGAFRDAAEILPLLAPLSVGDPIGLGYRLEELSGVVAGAAVLTLRAGTRFARIHVCRRDGTSRALAHTAQLDFMLMNDGNGARPTDERLARVVKVLAELVRKNEAAGAASPVGLLSHATRMESFASCGKLV